MQKDPRRQPQQSTQKRTAPPNIQQPRSSAQQTSRQTPQRPPQANRPSQPQQNRPQYRSAAPYSVSPRQGAARVPYPPSEQRRRQMLRRKQRRKRIAALTVVTLLCLLLIAGIITAAVLVIRQALDDKPESDTAIPGVSDNMADMTAAPTPPETEPPLPEYSVLNKIEGIAVTRTFSSS